MTAIFNLPIAVRALAADLNGDEQSNRLPKGFAMALTYAMMRNSAEHIDTLAEGARLAGWAAFVAHDVPEAQRCRNAHDYCGAAREILTRTIND
jgi:hypothetical protein